jgi:hypothetical protein
MSQETADLAIAAVRGQFTVVSVPDEETQRHWERMVSGGNVVGNEHHDAYLAAGMVSQGISQILTSNAKHFHFPGVTALAPDTVNRGEYVSSLRPPSGHLPQSAPTLHADATHSRGLVGPVKSAPQAVSASQSQSTVAPARQPSPAEPPPAVKEAKHQERESSSLHAQRQRDEQTQKAAQAQARQAEAHSRGGRSR